MARAKGETAQPLGVSPGGIDVIDRAVSILLAFRAGDPPLNLTEVSVRTGLYKSTVLRLTAALCHHHLLTRLDDGRYQLGALNYTLGVRYESNLNLSDMLLPSMRELNDALGETIAFHIREKEARVCLLRVNSRFSVRAEVKPGDMQALERGAGGRILLAFSGESGEPYDTIRHDYCYLSLGERDAETAGISAPVFGPSQKLLGAMGIVTPVTRMTSSQAAVFTVALLGIAARVTAQLGGDASPMLDALSRYQQRQGAVTA